MFAQWVVVTKVYNDLRQAGVGENKDAIFAFIEKRRINIHTFEWADGLWGSFLQMNPKLSQDRNITWTNIKLLEHRGSYSLLISDPENDEPLSDIGTSVK